MKVGFDIYPALTQQFESDPGMDYIDVTPSDGQPTRRVTRLEWERERLSRDMFRLLKPIGRPA